MNLKFKFDAAKFAEQFKNFAVEVENDIQKGIATLAAQTHARVLQMAEENLSSATFLEFRNTVGFDEISPGIYIISVAEEGMWVEEGVKPNTDMKPALLKNGKTSKSGTKYKVIPFDYGKTPSRTGTAMAAIIPKLEQELKKQLGGSAKGIIRRIERNADGSPKVGKLHEFNFGNPNGRMGGPGKGNTPIFNGVSIYQTVTATGNVRRDVMTFRTVSSGPASAGKWIHPGLKAQKFLDKAFEMAIKDWEQNKLPEILAKWK